MGNVRNPSLPALLSASVLRPPTRFLPSAAATPTALPSADVQQMPSVCEPLPPAGLQFKILKTEAQALLSRTKLCDSLTSRDVCSLALCVIRCTLHRAHTRPVSLCPMQAIGDYLGWIVKPLKIGQGRILATLGPGTRTDASIHGILKVVCARLASKEFQRHPYSNTELLAAVSDSEVLRMLTVMLFLCTVKGDEPPNIVCLSFLDSCRCAVIPQAVAANKTLELGKDMESTPKEGVRSLRHLFAILHLYAQKLKIAPQGRRPSLKSGTQLARGRTH